MFSDTSILQVDKALAELTDCDSWDSPKRSLVAYNERQTRKWRRVSLTRLREFLSCPVTEFDNSTVEEQEAALLLDSLFNDDDDVIVDIDWESLGNPREGIYDPRVQGTRFTFIGSGMHRYVYYDSITKKVYKRLRDFGDTLLEDAFWAEERLALKTFKQYEPEATERFKIRYAETSFHRLDNGRTYMIQEYFPLTSEWLTSDDFITIAQEEFLYQQSYEDHGLSVDLCADNCARDQDGNLVLLDMLHITYNAYVNLDENLSPEPSLADEKLLEPRHDALNTLHLN